jgi:PAS domain S-box-containing protein
MLVGQLSLLLLVLFVSDATVTVWRRGNRRQALAVGGSIVFFTLAGTVQAVLVLWEVIHWPMTTSFFYLGIVATMAYEMSREALRAAQLSDDLRESEERMTLASEAAGFGVWMWNIQRDQVWGSERWLGLFGFASDATVTFESLIQRIHPDDREGVEHAVRRAVADRSDYAAEYRVVLPDDTQRWVTARGRVYPDAHGKPVRMMGATIDITARKQAEAEALRQRAELAHVARVSTMGELAASVAHELNQPLGAILANAEAADLFLSQDPPALDELRAILIDIRQDDERASEVIRRMRALLRKQELERLPLEINSVVEDVLQVVSGDAALRKIAIGAELAPGLPKVLGDRVHLQQVLLNLMLNGMDAMAGEPRERRRLSIRTRSSADGLVELAVTDLGHGIEPEKLPRLFEAFYTTKPNGMGMGLSISRTIIEAHHGRIWAENNAGGGAVFRVALPGIG